MATKIDKPLQHSHAGHRKRLRSKYRKHGLSSFHEHEVLEFLLSFVIARRDTNELSHQLIEKFGSVSNVIDAPYDALIECKGVSEVVATFLKFLPDFMDQYMRSRHKDKIVIQKSAEAKCIIEPLLMNMGREHIIIIMIDGSDNYMGYEIIDSGERDYISVGFDEIIRAINKYGAKNIVIAHNHPSGSIDPSCADISYTKRLYMRLRAMGIELLDHLIYARNNPTPYSFNDCDEYNDFRLDCRSTLSKLNNKII